MTVLIALFALGLGSGAGALSVFVVLTQQRQKLRHVAEWQKTRECQLDERVEALRAGQQKLDTLAADLESRSAELDSKRKAFDARFVSYQELENEGAILKRDLRNRDVELRKRHLDMEEQRRTQEQLDQRARELGSRYLKENVKAIASSLSANNYTACKQRLLDVIERCRGIGSSVSTDEEASLLQDLKADFEKAVRIALQREEQARIKAQLREEQKLQREIDRELERVERERAAIEAALEKAIAEAKDAYSEEVELLKVKLGEAEARSQRAISRAQMTKAGNVYVISNIGSFGEGMFKIGASRRLEPLERVRELGDASVPFPFDVHMMIASDDALGLEQALHRELHKSRVNKVKPRKEFFKTDIETIRRIVEGHYGTVEYVAEPEALEYHQSLTMSDEDAEYIESVYESDEEESEPTLDDQ